MSGYYNQDITSDEENPVSTTTYFYITLLKYKSCCISTGSCNL